MSKKNRGYIYVGQSWASGRSLYANLPAEFEGYKHNMRMFNSPDFEILLRNAGNNHFGDSFAGWGMEFPMTDLADHFGADIYLLKYSIGGSQLAQQAGDDWNAASVGEYTDNLLTYIDEVEAWMSGRGKEMEWRGIIYFQVERDAQDLAKANAFGDNMQDWYDKVNNHVGFVLPIYHYYCNDFVAAYTYRDEANGITTNPIQGKHKFHQDNSLSRIVFVNDITHTEDNVHPDANGNQQLWDKFGPLLKADDNLILERVPFDSDAEAYFTAAGITDEDEKIAVDDLVKAYKIAGIWDKFIAIYPISPTSFAAAQVNLKNPGTFDLTLSGSPVHASSGFTMDGVDDILQTGIIDTDLSNNNTRISVYSSGSTDYRNGSILDSDNRMILFSSGVNVISDHYSGSGGGREIVNVASDYDGYLVSSRGANNLHKIYRDGTEIGDNPSTTSIGSVTGIPEIYFGSWNNNGTPDYGNGEYRAMEVGEYLTSDQEMSANAAMQAYQTALSRNV